MDLTIVIISYNTRALTLVCLASLYRETRGITFEVIVLDNASDDGSADAIAAGFPQVKLIRSETNLGFARANNVAAEQATGAYLLLLNPDTVVLDGAVEELLRFAKAHPEAGIVGGRTFYPDGSLNPTSCWQAPTLWSTWCRTLGLAYLFRGTRFFDPEGMAHWARDSVREVDIVTGCLLMCRRSIWTQLGGFDSAFFMYGEEFDLCLRAAKLGYKCMIDPQATIVHHGSASEKVRAEKMIRLFRSHAQLFRKHWRPGAARLGLVMLRFRAFTRMLACRVMPWRDAETQEIWRVIWRRRNEWCRP